MQLFHFKQFSLHHGPGLKVTTEACILGAWSQLPGPRLADLGTGTGLLALMLAQRYPSAHITAVEIDPEMAALAHQNVSRSPYTRQIEVIQADVYAFALANSGRFDGIIVNPPFFINQLPRRQPLLRQATHGDDSTLSTWLHSISLLLSVYGAFTILLPPAEVDAFTSQAALRGYSLRRALAICHRPGASPLRHALEFGNTVGPLQSQTLYIRNADEQYSEQYRQLLGSFNTIF